MGKNAKDKECSKCLPESGRFIQHKICVLQK